MKIDLAFHVSPHTTQTLAMPAAGRLCTQGKRKEKKSELTFRMVASALLLIVCVEETETWSSVGTMSMQSGRRFIENTNHARKAGKPWP